MPIDISVVTIYKKRLIETKNMPAKISVIKILVIITEF